MQLSAKYILYVVAMFSTIGFGVEATFASNYEDEIPTWTKEGMFAGASVKEKDCSLAEHVWIRDGDDGFCIRYFKNSVASNNGTAIIFLQGDLVGSNWDKRGYPTDPTFVGDSEGEKLFSWVTQIVSRQRVPFFFVSRPGTHGSSGDHKKKYQPQEARVINLAIDEIKARYQLKAVVLAGQSGGATLIANILPKRTDVSCAVMGSGAVALWRYSSDHNFASEVYRKWEDPLASAEKTHEYGARLYVLAGFEDRTRPKEYQKSYADALTKKGLEVEYLVIATQGNPHDLVTHSLLVARNCAAGESKENIRRLLNLAK